jgi:hypothetical protein
MDGEEGGSWAGIVGGQMALAPPDSAVAATVRPLCLSRRPSRCVCGGMTAQPDSAVLPGCTTVQPLRRPHVEPAHVPAHAPRAFARVDMLSDPSSLPHASLSRPPYLFVKRIPTTQPLRAGRRRTAAPA